MFIDRDTERKKMATRGWKPRRDYLKELKDNVLYSTSSQRWHQTARKTLALSEQGKNKTNIFVSTPTHNWREKKSHKA